MDGICGLDRWCSVNVDLLVYREGCVLLVHISNRANDVRHYLLRDLVKGVHMYCIVLPCTFEIISKLFFNILLKSLLELLVL